MTDVSTTIDIAGYPLWACVCNEFTRNQRICAQDSFAATFLRRNSVREAFTSELTGYFTKGVMRIRALPTTLHRGVRLHPPGDEPRSRREMSFFTASLDEAKKYAKHTPNKVRAAGHFPCSQFMLHTAFTT